jgi:hypothetical protein
MRPTARLRAVGARVCAAVGTAREHVRTSRLRERGQRSLLDALAPEWTEHRPDAYVVGARGRETWTRTLAVRDWPHRVTAGWLAPLLFDLGGDVALAMHVDRLPTGRAAGRLKAQRVVQASVAQARLERGAIADPAEQLDLTSPEVAAVIAQSSPA